VARETDSKMPFISVGSNRLYYQLIGQGRPVVFVNGWTMSSDYWLPAVEQLRNGHHCLLYDSRGFGRSLPVEGDAAIEIDEHAEDLHELITRLNMSDVDLVAHGLGVWIAVLLARRHPQDVGTLTAVAPEFEQEEDPKEIPSIWRQASLMLKDLASLPVLRNLVTWRYRNAPEPFRTRLCEDFAHADRRIAFHMLASCMGHDNRQRLRNALSELSLPVMLVRGTEDRICPDPLMRTLFDLIKLGRLATVRGCGHLPMLEFTSEFAKLLADFFTKNGRSSRHMLLGS
jgi:pimeloyl-ACP methyl ester carboxylesterase